MATILELLLEPGLGYAVCEFAREQDPGALYCLDEVELSRRARESKGRKMLLPGLKTPTDTLYFYRNAQVLGQMGLEMSSRTGDTVLAVLFRDSDGTHSSPRTLWSDKMASAVNGFKSVGFESGVPMIPKPKSEAWLICALKSPPYLHCHDLENASGNDDSPNSLKSQLAALTGPVSAEALADLVRGTNPLKISMPSFARFYECLVRAADRCGIELPSRPDNH